MNKSKKTLASIALALMSVASVQAQKLNLPLIQTKYTADPAPYVHGDIFTPLTMKKALMASS